MKILIFMILLIALFFYLSGLSEEKLSKERANKLGNEASSGQKAPVSSKPKEFFKVVK